MYTRQALTYFEPTELLCESGGDLKSLLFGQQTLAVRKTGPDLRSYCAPLQSMHEEMETFALTPSVGTLGRL